MACMAHVWCAGCRARARAQTSSGPRQRPPTPAGVYKAGGAALAPPQTLLTCAALAHARQREVAEQLEAALRAAAEADADAARVV